MVVLAGDYAVAVWCEEVAEFGDFFVSFAFGEYTFDLFGGGIARLAGGFCRHGRSEVDWEKGWLAMYLRV